MLHFQSLISSTTTERSSQEHGADSFSIPQCNNTVGPRRLNHRREGSHNLARPIDARRLRATAGRRDITQVSSRRCLFTWPRSRIRICDFLTRIAALRGSPIALSKTPTSGGNVFFIHISAKDWSSCLNTQGGPNAKARSTHPLRR